MSFHICQAQLSWWYYFLILSEYGYFSKIRDTEAWCQRNDCNDVTVHSRRSQLVCKPPESAVFSNIDLPPFFLLCWDILAFKLRFSQYQITQYPTSHPLTFQAHPYVPTTI